jgi:5-methylcytosine-specific restriction protein A
VILREGFDRVLNEYLRASKDNFAKHELANFIRGELRNSLVQAAGENDRLVFKGSAGQGNWARGPWVGIFDKLITTSAQTGYYAVYLFREDMEGVYLSLNQGMTEAKRIYKSDAKTVLRTRAANYRAMLGNQIRDFPELNIDLAPSKPTNDTAFYEAGNICAKSYPTGQLPRESQLIDDLITMIKLYEGLISVENNSEAITIEEGDEPLEMHYEDATRFRMHKRIERNAGLSKRVKQLLGVTCQVCNVNFEERYGKIGENYIEAHHLIPLASIKGNRVAMDPKKDFAVLCANCHRMIHRTGCVDNIDQFKEEHYRDQS